MSNILLFIASLCEYMSLFIHSHADEHLGFFQVWTVTNKAAMHIILVFL